MFGWFQRLLPRTGDFFGMFEAHAATLVAAADALSRLSEDDSSTKEQLRIINDREHDADDIIREVLTTVRRTFLTPFDRGAITSLIAAMDDAIDEMQSTARAIDVYSITKFEPEMKQMATIIGEATRLIADALPLMRTISRNGAKIHVITERVVSLEGDADIVHAAGLKRAFEESSPVEP